MTKHSRSLFEKISAQRETHLPAEDLARYIDSLLIGAGSPLPAKLVSHVENCYHCQCQILDVLFYLRDPLRQPDTALAQDILPINKRRPFWLLPAVRIAAAAFVFILLAALYFILPRQQIRESSTAVSVSPSPAPGMTTFSLKVPDKRPEKETHRTEASRSAAAIAKVKSSRSSKSSDAFAINPNLESMVGSRSRGFTIEVYSPPNHVTLSQEITFSWKEFSREPLSLAIVNNRNETIFKNPVSNGSFLFRAALPSGCYYWKLESAVELYYVGKFFVDASPKSPKE